MKREDLAWLLDMANEMRAAKGDEQLDDLPDATPQDANSCLIANAFNYGCEVAPTDINSMQLGKIYFQNGEDVETYLKIVGQQYRIPTRHLSAYLTIELNALAIEFDRGNFPEYDRYRVHVGSK